MGFNPYHLTWGLELEFGDVPRDLPIPEHLGSWEYFETDIVNQNLPYRGIAVDPRGMDPPVGGEINTRPTDSISSQLDLVDELLRYIRSHGYEPTVSCMSNTHVHVGIPTIHDRFLLNLRKILLASLRYQDLIMALTYQFEPTAEMALTATALDYLTNDSGRRISEDKVYEILCDATTPDLFFDMYRISTSDPSQRYAINLNHLDLRINTTDTIEFRFFRCTTDINQIHNMMRICQAFLVTAAEDHWNQYLLASISQRSKENFEIFKLAKDLKLKTNNFTNLDLRCDDFPRLMYDHDLYSSWERTRRAPDFSRLKPRMILDPLGSHDPDD